MSYVYGFLVFMTIAIVASIAGKAYEWIFGKKKRRRKR